jgi:glycosyltransferase involved in cell wall biosynthesis
MPTFNRRPFVPLAIEYFLRQDFEDSELVIVDDGSDPVVDLVPDSDRIRYIRLPAKVSVGAKRNAACTHARGEIIAHWDDDDWHAPHRLRYQVEALQRSGMEICGIRTLLFFNPETQRAWKYIYTSHQLAWLGGSTLCYTRAFWSGNRFQDINVGEDTNFVARSRVQRMLALPESDFHIGIVHSGNVSPKQTEGTSWSPLPPEEIRRMMGADWSHYAPAGDAAPVRTIPIARHERSLDLIAIARKTDLSLTEFAAFNQGQNLPWMRRWELPFALFQSRLENTMSVLDCSINPAGLRERMGRLYPHVLYRQWSPIQCGQFALPLGVPDGAFDRVICVNTLEHLLQPQRVDLMAAMTRKLKPGGWLVLTSDHYFDSAWENPAFLKAGVMRNDRAEVFNGYNKVSFTDFQDLAAANGLEPLAPIPDADPREDDDSLYRNPDPHPHACIAGVFARKLHAPAAKKFCWRSWRGTRAISAWTPFAPTRARHGCCAASVTNPRFACATTAPRTAWRRRSKRSGPRSMYRIA